jgi:hypothetical protein
VDRRTTCRTASNVLWNCPVAVMNHRTAAALTWLRLSPRAPPAEDAAPLVSKIQHAITADVPDGAIKSATPNHAIAHRHPVNRLSLREHAPTMLALHSLRITKCRETVQFFCRYGEIAGHGAKEAREVGIPASSARRWYGTRSPGHFGSSVPRIARRVPHSARRRRTAFRLARLPAVFPSTDRHRAACTVVVVPQRFLATAPSVYGADRTLVSASSRIPPGGISGYLHREGRKS